MTKEEKIKEAYGECYNKVKGFIDADGWCDFKKAFPVSCNFRIYDVCDEKNKWRPKSLQGIEDNNGWISLSGEPNEIEWVENLELYNIETKEHYFCTDENEFIEIGRFTHYKPIVKSKPPIY